MQARAWRRLVRAHAGLLALGLHSGAVHERTLMDGVAFRVKRISSCWCCFWAANCRCPTTPKCWKRPVSWL